MSSNSSAQLLEAFIKFPLKNTMAILVKIAAGASGGAAPGIQDLFKILVWQKSGKIVT